MVKLRGLISIGDEKLIDSMSIATPLGLFVRAILSKIQLSMVYPMLIVRELH